MQGKAVGRRLRKLVVFCRARSFFSLVPPFCFILFFFIINEKKLPTSYCRSASKSLPKSPRCFTRLVRAERQHNPQEAPLISRNNSALVKLISGEY